MSEAFDIFEEVQAAKKRFMDAKINYQPEPTEVEMLTQHFIERGVSPRTARYWAECEAEQPA